MKRSYQIGGAIAIVVIIIVLLTLSMRSEVPPEPSTPPIPETAQELPPSIPLATSSITTIGTSVEGRSIEAYRFGTGSTSLLFVGGIHGGYEWNSVLLAYDAIDYFNDTPTAIPENISLYIIPALNPDGLVSVIGKEGRFSLTDVPKNNAAQTGQGRFNKNGVDLNRNFDCKWQPTSTWRSTPVSAGAAAFSEPEAAALRDFVFRINPSAVVFWHSQANTVYASECENGVLPKTLSLMNTYASAADYLTQATFDAYPVTGDAEGWLASIGIPAITVELKTRTSPEWEQNKRGIEAILQSYR